MATLQISDSILHSEIFEQPAAVRQFLEQQTATVANIGRELSQRYFNTIFIAARGTSDNAARYGQYLFGMHNRLTVTLAAPSLFTRYGAPPQIDRALVIGISQSGQSPDVCEVVEEARRQGAPTVAITNEPESPLAKSADYAISLGVGRERSVAATKTYTAELAALALLSVQMSGQPEALDQMQSAPEWMEAALAGEEQAVEAARLLASFDRCVTIGRGFNYATAFEIALKIKELAYVEAEPYSSADFRHGPIALADSGMPVVLVSAGVVFRGELAALQRDLSAQGSPMVVLTDGGIGEDLPQAAAPSSEILRINLPERLPEWLTPLAAVLPGQLLAYHLALARGSDPDCPRTIRKVTRTL